MNAEKLLKLGQMFHQLNQAEDLANSEVDNNNLHILDNSDNLNTFYGFEDVDDEEAISLPELSDASRIITDTRSSRDPTVASDNTPVAVLRMQQLQTANARVSIFSIY